MRIESLKRKHQKPVKAFERELSVARSSAPSTVKRYLHEVVGLLMFLEKRHKTYKSATRDDFLDWKEELDSREPAGVNVAIVAARSFFNFLVETEQLTSSRFPASMKSKPKQQAPTSVPSVTQTLGIRAALATPISDPRALDKATREALVETLAGSGLRVSTLLSIKPRHLRLSGNPHIMIESGDVKIKSSKAGGVPISPYCAKILGDYVAAKGISDRPIFEVSESVVRKVVKSLSPVGMSLKPHSFRHFYIAMLYYKNFEGGRFDVVYARDAAGHSSIAVTDKYLQLAKTVCKNDEQWDEWANGSLENREEKTA